MNGGFGRVGEVLDGIDHALAAGLGPVKINAVIQRGVNEGSVLPLVERFRGTGITVRFIEYMDVGNRNDWREQLVVPSKDLQALIHERWPLRRRQGLTTRVKWRVATRSRMAQGQVGFISSVTQPFCGACYARATVVRRRVLHLPVRPERHRPARPAARRDADDAELNAADPRHLVEPDRPLQRAADDPPVARQRACAERSK